MEPTAGCSHLSDVELREQFESLQLSPAAFHHADHVRLAWIYVRELGPAAAEQCLLEGIRKLAIHAGAPMKFLYTATVAWARLVAAALQKDSADVPFAEWIARHPELLNKDLLDEFYSAGTLKADPARSYWFEPDRKPLKL
jgi:hypothetical protein